MLFIRLIIESIGYISIDVSAKRNTGLDAANAHRHAQFKTSLKFKKRVFLNKILCFFFSSPLPLLFCLPSPTLPFPFSNGGSCSWLPLDVSPKTPSKRFPPVSIQSYSRFVRAHERVPSTPSLPFRNLFYSISSTFFFFFTQLTLFFYSTIFFPIQQTLDRCAAL